jgi:hypothetical protein
MSEAPGNARLEEFLREQIPRLAILYDRFAHALDPFDQGRDIAEQTFNSELATWFDALPEPRPTFREFRRLAPTQNERRRDAAEDPGDPRGARARPHHLRRNRPDAVLRA